MQLRIFRNRNVKKFSMPQIMLIMMYWTLTAFMLLQQIKTTDAVKFKGDNCMTKNQPGICRLWSECSVIKTLIETGEYTIHEVVNCGFDIREELICCPVIRSKPDMETTTVESDRFLVPTTTQTPVTDFWLPLLQKNTTTAAPDFWADLLKPTTTTTISSTMKPLIIGEQRLNESSKFFDINSLLSGNKGNSERLTNSGGNKPNMNPSNAGFVFANGNNGRGNVNTGPINMNQWNFGQHGDNFNRVSGRPNNNGGNKFWANGNGNIGRGQLNKGRGQQNFGRGQLNGQQNFGRGQLNGQQNNGRGRGNQNNGKGRNVIGNQNAGFIINENNMRPTNQFFANEDTTNRRTGRNVNTMETQNSNTVVANNPNNNKNNNVQNEDSRINDIIKNVFDTSEHVLVQPLPQQFVQHSQFIHQPSFVPSQFGQGHFQSSVHESETLTEVPSSAPAIQQFVNQPNSDSPLIEQSPPTQIFDPFKPFEFRPPPDDENLSVEDDISSVNPTHPRPDIKTNDNDRPAVRACQRIERGLAASLSHHILGGVPVNLGEFPHMVAIGYSRIGNDNRLTYIIGCGGTLIDKRFVLTAAHCVTDPNKVPAIVRLGVVNFTDPTEMSNAVELRIKETYIHDHYLARLSYNDIAILELERDVVFSEYIYPICLYTNVTDPDTKIKLWVSGWGIYNTSRQSTSNVLLKAPLYTTPLENCNKSFTEYGLTRKIPQGIISTQLCAEDKDQIKDACIGDSGGPLNLLVDETYKNYRLVGVISSGIHCASSTPGLYTRVAAFLDFIEDIVWPNGGD